MTSDREAELLARIEGLERERAGMSATVGEHVTVRGEYYSRALAAEARAAEALSALREIAFLRPGGPTGNRLAEQMERIAINALDRAASVHAQLSASAQAEGEKNDG